jgi:hypothetical protein
MVCTAKAWEPRGLHRLVAPTPTDLTGFLAAATVDPAVLALRPDYRVLLLAVDGLAPEEYAGSPGAWSGWASVAPATVSQERGDR